MFRATLPWLLFLCTAQGVAAQQDVARVKSQPQDYRDRQIELTGDVVEVRAVSPSSTTGIYRLVDASDPSGILIRTTDVPESSGPFRVRARLSAELLLDGALLLEELDREGTGTPLIPIAVTLAALGLAFTGVSLLGFLRTRRNERELRLAPPTWLVAPRATEQPTDAATPAFDYKLQYIEEERSAAIEVQKRRQVSRMAGGAVATVASGGWLTILLATQASTPSFVLLAPAAAQRLPSPGSTDSTADLSARPLDDTVRLGLVPPTPTREGPREQTASARRDTVGRRPTQVAVVPPSSPTPTRTVDSPARTAPPTRAADTQVVTPPPRDTAVVVVPPPVVRDTVRTVPPPAEPARTEPLRPTPDPAVLRAEAERDLTTAANRIVAAVTARQIGTLGALFPEHLGDPRRRQRFLEFVRDDQPEVTLTRLDAVTTDGVTGSATAVLGFRWRGDFGVTRQKQARVQLSTRRAGDRWALEGARLMDPLP